MDGIAGESRDGADLDARAEPPRPRTLIKSCETDHTSARCPGCGGLVFYPAWLCWLCRRICGPPEYFLDDDHEPDDEGDPLDELGELDELPAESWDIDWSQ